MTYLARLEINPDFLPLSIAHREWLAYSLSTLGAEYKKGEHRRTPVFEIRELDGNVFEEEGVFTERERR